MLLGQGHLASTVTEKTEALNLSQGPVGFRADWIVTMCLSLQSATLSPQLWSSSALKGLSATFSRNLPKESAGARV